MQITVKIIHEPAPPPRPRQPRLTQEIRDLQAGQCFETDLPTARCAQAYFRARGRRTTMRTRDGKVQVWILD